MKQIVFKNIRIQNFLSVGETPLELNFNSGITVITGENRDKGGRNGVGKSTIVESLYWVLFGSTMREIKREKIVHNQANKNCSVTLSFDIINGDKNNNYVLTRSIEPTKVSLICNEEDITRSSMPKTDDLVKELIGGSEEVFQNAVIMSANNTTPFMAQKKVDKRKFVEGILHLGVFGEMLLEIRQNFNDLKKQNDLLSFSFLDKQKNLDFYNQQYQKIENSKEIKIKNLLEKKEDNLLKIKEISETKSVEEHLLDLTKNIEKKESKIKSLKHLFKECEEASKSLWKDCQEIKLQISQKEKELNSLENTVVACPTCKRNYDHLDVCNLNELKISLQTELTNLNSLLKIASKKIKTQNTGCEKISAGIDEVESKLHKDLQTKESLKLASQQVQNLEVRNSELDKEIIDVQNSSNEFLPLIESVKKEIEDLEIQISDLQKKLLILEKCKYVVSEEGVKTFIIKKILNVLNSKLNFYLQALEAPCRCEFNEMFEETIYNDQGKECSYFNFSGGERKRIDLAILFMFQDLMRIQSGTRFSLSMYDELFDSAIDEKGVSKILDILRERVEKYQENIYIISHNKESLNSGINQFIFLEKHNGKTKILM